MPRVPRILHEQRIDSPAAVTGRSAEFHLANDDFFHVLEGEVEFVIGGKANGQVREGSNPADPTLISSAIAGGETHLLKEGDAIHIPAGVWHQWGTTGPVRMMVFKIPAAEGKVAHQP
ncbi:MAG: cupin domain-containing protein [Candidatus Wildermuthbacteria bacterium]|nr:cupin domain-containing protein [Candidatus Wildermuthbacteria bacterium]